MRYVLAVMVVVGGVLGLLGAIYGIGAALFSLTGPWVADQFSPNGHRWFIGIMSTIVGGVLGLVGTVIVTMIAHSYEMNRFIQWLESKKRIRPVPLSDRKCVLGASEYPRRDSNPQGR